MLGSLTLYLKGHEDIDVPTFWLLLYFSLWCSLLKRKPKPVIWRSALSSQWSDPTTFGESPPFYGDCWATGIS